AQRFRSGGEQVYQALLDARGDQQVGVVLFVTYALEVDAICRSAGSLNRQFINLIRLDPTPARSMDGQEPDDFRIFVGVERSDPQFDVVVEFRMSVAGPPGNSGIVSDAPRTHRRVVAGRNKNRVGWQRGRGDDRESGE